MNKLTMFVLIIGISILVIGYSLFKYIEGDRVKVNIEYMKIGSEEGKKLLDKNDNVILLDVRTMSEYEEKHIPNSILIPVDVLKSEAENKLNDKNKTIIVYCRSGNRSRTASNILLKLGYKNVLDMGGIIDWPYETVSGN